MKTLLINIYREETASASNTEVFNSGKDNILDGFYISLGMAIADGASANEYKPLVADFAAAKPTAYESFKSQWDELKLILLGENPKGEYEFQLSSEYLEWLKINAQTVYYQKYQGKHQASVMLDIEELYEDTVDAIRRKVLRFLQDNDNYKNFDEFVINDTQVNRRSKLVRAIKDKYEDNIAFVSYEKWMDGKDVCPKCGKNPCECGKPEGKVCPKCGKNPCECEIIKYDDECNVILQSVGPNNLQIIKLIKEWWGISKSEANSIVINAPSIVKTDVPGPSAMNFKSIAESMGAEVILETKKNDTDEMENGIFSYDGITLGKTTLTELKKKGFKIHRGFWRYDNKRSYVSAFKQYSRSTIVIDNWDYKDIDEWSKYFFANPSVVNIETLLNSKSVVTYFSFNWNDCPFLVRLGFYGDEDFETEIEDVDDDEYDDNDYEKEYNNNDDDYKNNEIANHISELFEEIGYIRIEPLTDDDGEHNITLVNKKPNVNGDHIFIHIDNEKNISFYANIVKEWVCEKTGKVYAIADNGEDDYHGHVYESNTYFDKPGNMAFETLENVLQISGDEYHLGDTLISIGVDEDVLKTLLSRCARQLRIEIHGGLDVYEDKVSDFVRLIQDNYYATHKRL